MGAQLSLGRLCWASMWPGLTPDEIVHQSILRAHGLFVGVISRGRMGTDLGAHRCLLGTVGLGVGGWGIDLGVTQGGAGRSGRNWLWEVMGLDQVVAKEVVGNDWRCFFFFFWLCWVFVSVRGLSLVAARGGHSSLRCAGLSLSWPLLLRSTGSIRAGSVVVAHGPSCSAACGIFPDQGSNPCPLHWQADSQPLHHQGSPGDVF